MQRVGYAFLIVALLSGLFNPSAHGWVTEVVDRAPSGGEGGEGSSIALDSTGAVHIASLNSSVDGVQYTTNVSGDWETVLLDLAAMTGTTSIAVDTADKIHISYMGHNGLKYATNASGVWVTSYVHEYDPCDFWSCSPPHSTSIALDNADIVHISYTRFVGYGPLEEERQLRHALGGSDGWATEEVALGVAPRHSLAVDGSDKVHISYSAYREGSALDLKYATNTSGAWVLETVDVSPEYPAIDVVVDGLGHVHIIYSSPDGIKHASDATGSWVIDTVGVGGGTPSMVMDASDNLHIVCESSGIKYATNLSGTWSEQSLAEGDHPSIAVGGTGNIHISYHDSGSLNHAANDSGVWVTAALPSPTDLGKKTSIALDSSGKLHISYLDHTTDTLKYATNASGTWVAESVGPARIFNTSIAWDASDSVHIAYRDHDGLGYAIKASGVWMTETADADGGVGNAIAVDKSGKIHIASSGVKYVTNVSGTWVTEEIDPSGGNDLFLALDSEDNVHACYRKYSTEYYFTYATNASGSWVSESLGKSHGECSIAMDSADKVHIAYSDVEDDQRYVTNASGVWVDEFVDLGIIGIMNPALALDTSGKAHLSYRSETCLAYWFCSNIIIKYSTNASGSWKTRKVSDAPGDSVGYGDHHSIAIGPAGTVYISHYHPEGTLLLTSGIPPSSFGWGAASTVESESRRASSIPSYLILLGIPVGIILLWRARSGRPGLWR